MDIKGVFLLVGLLILSAAILVCHQKKWLWFAEKSDSSQKTAFLTYAITVLAAGLFTFLWFRNDIGISKNSFEANAHGSSKIQADWQVTMQTTDAMSAMVFYPEDKSDHSFQIYVKRPGVSFGYFFRGGNLNAVEDSIVELAVETIQDNAFLSLNSQQVAKVEIDNGSAIETIDLGSSKPFAIVFPKNTGSITFFDVNGNVADPITLRL